MRLVPLGLLLLSMTPVLRPVYSVAGKPTPVPVPNGDCSDSSLRGFRYRYDAQVPNMQEQYVENHKWVSHQVIEGRKCVAIRAPKSVLEIQTAKVETALVPIEPGATYKYMVDVYLDQVGCKMWAETFAVDPRPDAVREEEEAKGKRISLFRFRPENGYPALFMVHRSADSGGPNDPKTWGTWEKEATLPAEWTATLPFTLHGDGTQEKFPVPVHPQHTAVKYDVVEVRLRKATDKLPFRQNKGHDWKFEEGHIVFTKAPPAQSEVTVMVRWKVKPQFMLIKAIALGGANNSTAAFTNFRIIKTKESGEAPAPTDTVIR